MPPEDTHQLIRSAVMPMSAKRSRDGRESTNRYANGARRRALRAWLAAQGLPCHICGQPIDYDLDWYVDPRDGRVKRHPMSFEVDELIPVSLGGSPIDRSNVAPAHRICNERRGNKISRFETKPPPPSELKQSRKW